jgi:phosphoserine phosphatase
VSEHAVPTSLPDGLARALAQAPRGFALFDADGTLWREDVGEAFLRHLVALRWVQLPSGRDPYEAYEEAVQRDRRSGYAFAAQLLAGLPAAQVQAEAARFAAEWVPPRLLPATKVLIAACRSAGHEVAVVSASQVDVVRAAVVHAGIPWDRCAGIATRLSPAGLYTDAVLEPITYAAGKVQLAHARGWTPIALAAGDSITGDLPLLESAAVAVAVGELPLAAEARRRGWHTL